VDTPAPAPAGPPTIRRSTSSGTINYVPGRDATPIAPSADRPVRTITRPTPEPARVLSAQSAAVPRDDARQAVPARVDPRSISRDDSASEGRSIRTSPSGPTQSGMPSDWPSDYRPSRSFSRSGSSASDQSSGGGSPRGRR
jgi:hypothetical protein